MSWHAKAVVALVIAYALSPVDHIPDFFPVCGYLDDLLLVPLGIALAVKLIPAEVMAESRVKAIDLMADGRPTLWIGYVVVGAVWLLVAVLAVRLFLELVR